MDELPQSGSGRTIMTTQPKFVPGEAVTVSLGDQMPVRVRMVDSVGYLVEGALGRFEGEIIKLDRPKGRALIQYQFDNAVYKTWVGFDMIDDPVTIPRPGEKKDG